MQILEAKKLIWKQKVWKYFQHHSVSFGTEHEIPSYHYFTIMPLIFHMTTRVWVKHREVRVCVHDIMVCYDLEAIFGEGKNIRSPCVQWYVQCTVHGTVGVQHEWSPSVSQLWPEHRMETTGEWGQWQVRRHRREPDKRTEDGLHNYKGGRWHGPVISSSFLTLSTSVFFYCKK